mmetsp:Transcript_86520/g.253256  ORF Transcript_86520/g.253256 Transcript_86520/m.253256 type:complete len:295 (-) Transcript_86520:102-986(-)
MIPIPIPIPRVDTQKKPDHVVEGVLQGMNKWCDHVGDGASKLWRKSTEGHQREGALGAAKGVGGGLLDLATGVGKGTCDFLGSTLEGVRHTPDAVADKVNKDRKHNKHGVEGEGRGELLETYLEEEEKEPEHIGEGLVSGARGFGKSLASGWKDLVGKPMEGARESGAAGFAKGAGQGLLGFSTKAASGTIDLASSLLSGAKNTPDAIGKAVKVLRERSNSGTLQESNASGSSSSASAAAPGGDLFPGRSRSTSSTGEKPFVAFEGGGHVLGAADEEDTKAESSASPPVFGNAR